MNLTVSNIRIIDKKFELGVYNIFRLESLTAQEKKKLFVQLDTPLNVSLH